MFGMALTTTLILVGAGLRVRSANASNRRRPHLLDTVRSSVEQVKSPPPRYNADPLAASVADDVTTATATATPFAMSISQVRIQTIDIRFRHVADFIGAILLGIQASNCRAGDFTV